MKCEFVPLDVHVLIRVISDDKLFIEIVEMNVNEKFSIIRRFLVLSLEFVPFGFYHDQVFSFK